MTKNSTAGIGYKSSLESRGSFIHSLALAKLLLGLLLSMTVIGCQTQSPPPNNFTGQTANPPEAIVLREGDVIKISFPGAPNLNTTPQTIRRDGKISGPLGGEVTAAGMTPAELEKELVKRYANELTSKEVTVTVESSSFPIFVTGAVIKPGKISPNRPMTVLEAIMEAGGPDYTKANLKAVKVIRQEGGQMKNYTLNLKAVMDGERIESFYLKPSDIVYVKERLVIF